MALDMQTVREARTRPVELAAGLVDRLPFAAMVHDGAGEPVAWSRTLEPLIDVPPQALSVQAFWEGGAKLCGEETGRQRKSLGPFPVIEALASDAAARVSPARLRVGGVLSQPLAIEAAPLPHDGESSEGVITAFAPAGCAHALRPHSALMVASDLHGFVMEQLDQLKSAEDAYRATGALDRETIDIVVRRSLQLTRLALTYAEPGLETPPPLPFQPASPAAIVEEALGEVTSVDGRRPFQTFAHCEQACPLDRRDLVVLAGLVFDIAAALTEDGPVSLALTAEPAPAPICITASWEDALSDLAIRNGGPSSRCRPALNAVFALLCKVAGARLNAAGFASRWEVGERHVSLLSEPRAI